MYVGGRKGKESVDRRRIEEGAEDGRRWRKGGKQAKLV